MELNVLHKIAKLKNSKIDLKIEEIIKLIDEIKKIEVPKNTKKFYFHWIGHRTREDKIQKDEVNIKNRIKVPKVVRK